MRKIGLKEIEDMATGAAVLGGGGGGDPYIGKLMALQAIEEYGEITLLNADEIPEDALVVSSAMMGAPTVLFEKTPGGNEAAAAFKELEKYMDQEIYATFPIEAGGLNSMLPLALAAREGIPVVDADGMGRAFPELQMTTFYLDGIDSTPMVMADEKGNTNILSTISNEWTERIARASTVEMGGSVMMSIYPMAGKNLRESGIQGILTLEEEIGRIIRESKENKKDPIKELLKVTKGVELFQGKIGDIERKTDAGFAKGIATIKGMDDYEEKTLQLHFQNEHLLAKVDEKVVCTTPDLIAVLDKETGQPITTEGIRYGSRCFVIGIPSDDKWRTEKGMELVGPQYFGYHVDYVPVERIVEEEGD